MATFRIDPRSNPERVLLIEADDHEASAHLAAKRWFGRQACAQRSTGDPGKGGVFQGYYINGQRNLNSVGSGFHVMGPM